MFWQIAVEKFSEATVGYREKREIAEKWVQLFSTPYFMVSAVSAAAFPILQVNLMSQKFGTLNVNLLSEFIGIRHKDTTCERL